MGTGPGLVAQARLEGAVGERIERAEGRQIALGTKGAEIVLFVERKWVRVLRAKLSKDINLPRLPSIPGVLFSLSAPFEVWNAEDLKADPGRIGLSGSPTQVVKTYVMQRRSEAQKIDGEPAAQAEKIKDLIEELL